MLVINFWTILLGFGALQGYFFAPLLYAHRRGNRRANRRLAVFVLIVAYFLTVKTVLHSGLYREYPHLIGSAMALWYLIGPLCYGYVQALLRTGLRFRYYHLLHYLPFFYFFLGSAQFLSLPAGTKIDLYERFAARPPVIDIFWILSALQIVIYLFASWREIRRFSHRKPAERALAPHLRWLQSLLLIFLLYLSRDMSVALLCTSLELSPNFLRLLTPGMLSVFVLLVSLNAVRFPEGIFFTPPAPAPPKYRHSPLDAERTAARLARLEQLMREDKPYLNGELKLSDLAEPAGMSPHQLSQLLNEGRKTTFYEFVNGYRVREAARRLRDPAYRDYTILSIAYDVGFNSKATFNRFFKKQTGLTPSAYQRRRRLTPQRAVSQGV